MMEHNSQDSAVQSEQATESPVFSVGQVLREAREKQGMSIEDVATQIKLAPRQIEALEADDLSRLPELAFVRGFIRSYAKILKLDASALLSNMNESKPVAVELSRGSVDVPFPVESLVRRQNLIWSAVAIILVVLIAGFAVNSYMHKQEKVEETRLEEVESLHQDTRVIKDAEKDDVNTSEPSPSVQDNLPGKSPATPLVKPASEPSVKKLPVASPNYDPNTPPSSLRLEFDEESWVEIKDRDDNILASDIYFPGRVLQLEGNAPLSVLIGHAPSVRLYFRDKQVDLIPHTRRLSDVAHLSLD